MATYTKEYTIEFMKECEADSFEEAKKILDEMADKDYPAENFFHGEIEIIESDVEGED